MLTRKPTSPTVKQTQNQQNSAIHLRSIEINNINHQNQDSKLTDTQKKKKIMHSHFS